MEVTDRNIELENKILSLNIPLANEEEVENARDVYIQYCYEKLIKVGN